MIPFLILLLMAIIFCSSIEIVISLLIDNSREQISIEFCFFFGLIRFKRNYPNMGFSSLKEKISNVSAEGFKGNSNNSHEDDNSKFNDVYNKLKMAKGLINKYFRVIKYIVSKISWKVLIWEAEVGFNDAAITGFIVGIINIINSNIFAYLENNRYKFKRVSLNTKPNFDSNVINMDFNCIFSLRIGHIIIAGFKIIKIILEDIQILKGGVFNE